MLIKLNGTGKMGTMVNRVALKRGHEVTQFYHSDRTHICIDFSHPESVVKNIYEAAEKKSNIVVGTTGWLDHFDEVEKIIKDAGIGMLYSPNFSIGAYLHKQITAYAGKLMKAYSQYQITIHETHHAEKVDKPSGTALALKEELEASGIEVPVTSVRQGENPGNHTVIFESPEDTLTIAHQAHNREGFALGAIVAAEWLDGKKGIFTMADLL